MSISPESSIHLHFWYFAHIRMNVSISFCTQKSFETHSRAYLWSGRRPYDLFSLHTHKCISENPIVSGPGQWWMHRCWKFVPVQADISGSIRAYDSSRRHSCFDCLIVVSPDNDHDLMQASPKDSFVCFQEWYESQTLPARSHRHWKTSHSRNWAASRSSFWEARRSVDQGWWSFVSRVYSHYVREWQRIVADLLR